MRSSCPSTAPVITYRLHQFMDWDLDALYSQQWLIPSIALLSCFSTGLSVASQGALQVFLLLKTQVCPCVRWHAHFTVLQSWYQLRALVRPLGDDFQASLLPLPRHNNIMRCGVHGCCHGNAFAHFHGVGRRKDRSLHSILSCRPAAYFKNLPCTVSQEQFLDTLAASTNDQSP